MRNLRRRAQEGQQEGELATALDKPASEEIDLERQGQGQTSGAQSQEASVGKTPSEHLEEPHLATARTPSEISSEDEIPGKDQPWFNGQSECVRLSYRHTDMVC